MIQFTPGEKYKIIIFRCMEIVAGKGMGNSKFLYLGDSVVSRCQSFPPDFRPKRTVRGIKLMISKKVKMVFVIPTKAGNAGLPVKTGIQPQNWTPAFGVSSVERFRRGDNPRNSYASINLQFLQISCFQYPGPVPGDPGFGFIPGYTVDGPRFISGEAAGPP
jgi:hypothetical protein